MGHLIFFKMNKIKIYLLGICLCFMATSCGDFGDTNIDPNNPAKVSSDFLLTRAEKDIMDNTNDRWMGGGVTFVNAQYWAQNNYSDESRYNPRQDVTNVHFSAYYSTALNDLIVGVSRALAS